MMETSTRTETIEMLRQGSTGCLYADDLMVLDPHQSNVQGTTSGFVAICRKLDLNINKQTITRADDVSFLGIKLKCNISPQKKTSDKA